MCVVNLAEVTSHFLYNNMPPSAVDAMLHPLPMRLVDADAELSRSAGHLRALTAKAGLSLGDRFCLALARRQGLSAWTADRHWASIAGQVGVEDVIIR